MRARSFQHPCLNLLALSRLWTVACLLTLLTSYAALADEAAATTAGAESATLPRIPHLSPEKALESFDVQPGFRIELAAAEPEVADPVAMAFDERGRLFVVEMRGYSEQRDEKLGRVRRLEDTDGDGRFDKSVVYVDSLQWPTAVVCYDDGIFVAAAPDIFYFKDTTGDGHANVHRVAFTGFGAENMQGLINSFRWGLDNRIHGSAGNNEAKVHSPLHPDSPPVSVRRRGFSFDPRTLELETRGGTGQFGMSFDRWGNQIVCSNSEAAMMIMYDDRYLTRNPFLAAPNPLVKIYKGGTGAPVFRISPVEAWRAMRTRLRVSGAVSGPVEGGGTAAGYFTGASGVTVYQGDAFPAEFHNNAFIGDVAGNLMHRMVLEPHNVGLTARRADEGREFVASRDNWFRPVAFANAPDGVLYVADMYREVIEHPKSLPPVIKKQLDLTSGRMRGRIYRVVPDEFERRQPPRLDKASVSELVALLGHRNGWHRETAARLLFERGDSAAPPLLEELARSGASPDGRIRALYCLASLSALRADTILVALNDDNPHVRRHAVRLAENVVADSQPVSDKLCAMITDDDARVRYQLAFTLGEVSSDKRTDALARLARRDAKNRWMRMAILTSLGGGADRVLAELAVDKSFRRSKSGEELLAETAKYLGAKNDPKEIRGVLATIDMLSAEEPKLAKSLVVELAQGAALRGRSIVAHVDPSEAAGAAKLLQEVARQAAKDAVNEELSLKKRVRALRRLSVGSFDLTQDVASQLIDYRQPAEVQDAALSALTAFDKPEIAGMILETWDGLGPQLRAEALEALFSRRAWLESLLGALENQDLPIRDVPSPRAKLLLEHSDPRIRQRAEKLFAAHTPAERSKVLAAYRDVLKTKGDAHLGKQVFKKNCSACHRLEGVGHEIGPSLSAARNRGAEFILTNLLDPNREVNPEYVGYLVRTEQGKLVSGLIAAETATSVTLKRGDDATDTVLRADIAEMRSSGQSIMPEGLEKDINKKEMAALLAYLMSIR